MAIEKVREYFESFGAAARIREFDVSSATVELAAQALGCAPERIAKTLSFLVDGGCALVVAAGDAKVDNPRFKAQFHTKAKMLTPGEVEAMVGHAVGGCCFSKRMRNFFRKNEKSVLQFCNKKPKRKGRLQRVEKSL